MSQTGCNFSPSTKGFPANVANKGFFSSKSFDVSGKNVYILLTYIKSDLLDCDCQLTIVLFTNNTKGYFYYL